MANPERSSRRNPEKNLSLKYVEQILAERVATGEVVVSDPVDEVYQTTFYVSSPDGLGTPETVNEFLKELMPGHEPTRQMKSLRTVYAGYHFLCYGRAVYDSGKNGVKPIVVRAMPNEEFVKAAYIEHTTILERLRTVPGYSFKPEDSSLLCGIVRTSSHLPAEGQVSS